MQNHTLPMRLGTRVRYVAIAAGLVALLAIGYLVGNTVNALIRPPSSAAPAEAERPGGGALVEPPYRVQDFTLTSHTGAKLSLSDLRGHPVLMFFGYTHCPDVCPTTLADYRRVKAALGDNADAVRFVFVSIDGARDTPAVLADYLGQFDPDFIGLTGDEETLRQIGVEYGLLFQRANVDAAHEHEDGDEHPHTEDVDAQNYFVEHTSPSFLIDREGYLRLVYFYGTDVESIAQGILQMLR